MPARGGCWLGTKGPGLGHSSCNQVRDDCKAAGRESSWLPRQGAASPWDAESKYMELAALHLLRTWVCGWEALALLESVTELHLTSVIPGFQVKCNVAEKK